MADNLAEVTDAAAMATALESDDAGILRMARHLSTLLDVSQQDLIPVKVEEVDSMP